jgi:hypothetical protein
MPDPKLFAAEMALDKVAGEKIVRNGVDAGSTGIAVFDRYGIL